MRRFAVPALVVASAFFLIGCRPDVEIQVPAPVDGPVLFGNRVTRTQTLPREQAVENFVGVDTQGGTSTTEGDYQVSRSSTEREINAILFAATQGNRYVAVDEVEVEMWFAGWGFSNLIALYGTVFDPSRGR